MYRKFIEDDQEGVDEIIEKLTDFAARPEAEQCKADIDQVKDALAGAKPAFKKLADLEEKFLEPGIKPPADRKQYAKDRLAAIDEIKTAFGKGPPAAAEGGGGGAKPEDAKEDAVKGSGRDGPWYDPDDEMGAVLAADKLEKSFEAARQLLQSMILRQQEVENSRKLSERSLSASKAQSHMPNPLLQVDAIVPGDEEVVHDGGVQAPTEDFKRQMQAKFGKGDVDDYYDGRARVYEVSLDDDMLLDAVGAVDFCVLIALYLILGVFILVTFPFVHGALFRYLEA